MEVKRIELEVVKLYTELENGKESHLYFLSGEDITDKDHFINDDGLWQCNNGIIPNGLNPRKVVATTNGRIGIEREKRGKNTWIDRYPRPSKSFVEKYEALGTIKTALVDYEMLLVEQCNCECHTNDNVIHMVACCHPHYTERLRVDSNNEISVHPVKTSWNRGEVSELLMLAMATASAYGMKMDEANAKDWIRHNL